jgi:hypothetical protein
VNFTKIETPETDDFSGEERKGKGENVESFASV